MSRSRANRLTPADSAWLRMESPTNLMTITGLMTFDRLPELEAVRRRLEEKLCALDRFRCRVVDRGGPGRPQWLEHDGFSIADHVTRVSLPEPADKAALERFVSEQMSTPLDLERPLWRFHLVDNFDGRGALVMRVHHSMGDGRSLMRLTMAAMDEVPPEAAPPDVGHRGREGGRGLGRTLLGAGKAAAVGLRLLAMRKDPETAFKGELGIDKRASWSERLPLERVKRISRDLGGTVNDVLLSAMTGGLRRYLLTRESGVAAPDLRAVVPVNLRPATDLATLENRFGLVFLSLPVGVADPRERLRVVGERMSRLKSSPEAMVTYGLTRAVGRTTPRLQEAVVNLLGKNATAVMTNVPGPRAPLYLCGARIDDFMFWVPQSGRLGLGISILSYDGQVRVGVATDVGLVPDPQTIVAGFERSVDELLDVRSA